MPVFTLYFLNRHYLHSMSSKKWHVFQAEIFFEMMTLLEHLAMERGTCTGRNLPFKTFLLECLVFEVGRVEMGYAN